MHSTELTSAMLEPGFYPHAPQTVELRETHISWVFLAGDLAYKVKKPVVFPFLDYGSALKRHRMCREEVRLNRRLAPEIYRRVVGIVHGSGGWSLAPEDDPAAVEHAVEMRRVDESRSMAAILRRGELSSGQVSAVARRLARFHVEAAVAPPERRRVDVLVEALEENLATLRGASDGALDERQLDSAERFTRSFLAASRDDFAARGERGLVRDGHGDLRAEHVIVPATGSVYIYDCVEFNPGLRQIDVAADLAFLVMDLTSLGAEALAFQLVADYRRAGGDPGDDSLLSFLASYRAWVRAKVDCLRALELTEGDPERALKRGDAVDLLRLGHRFAWHARRPLALIVCGASGSGKSTLARRLADDSGWAYLSSDLTRKRLAGVAPTERAGAEHYSPRFTQRTYTEMGRLAAARLHAGGGAIVDATFHRRAERDAFRAGIGERPARLRFVECRARSEVLAARVTERSSETGRVSDADSAILKRQLAEFEPLAEVPPEERTELDTERSPADLAAAVAAFVDRSLWGRG